MNAIGYLRISIKDQSKYSLPDQDAAIRQYCAINKLDLIAVFQDNGQCSDTFDRADFRALEAFVKKHKGKVRYLIVKEHDRFSRDISEALFKIKELERKCKIKVLSVDEPLDINPNDPDVFIGRAFKYLMANQELLRIRKRTATGVRSALNDGRWVNNAPFGYKNAKDAEDKSTLSIVEEKAEIIRQIFKKFLAGLPSSQIASEARKKGFTCSGNSAIPRTLRNCLYAGLIKVPAFQKEPEKYKKAVHPPIIKESDYWLVQQMLDHTKPRKTHLRSDFPLRGILKCWCGHHMTAAWSSGKLKQYVYYFCKEHRSVNVSGTKLHTQFSEILRYLSLSDEQVKYLISNVKKNFESELESQSKQIMAKDKQLEEIEFNIEKLEGRLMRDEIESATYKKWYKKYQMEKHEIIDSINNLKVDKSKQLSQLHKYLPLLTNMPSIYEKINPEQRYLLTKKVFDHGLVYLNGTVRTPSLNPGLSHNSLILNEKGLLFIEQPSDFWGLTPLRSP